MSGPLAPTTMHEPDRFLMEHVQQKALCVKAAEKGQGRQYDPCPPKAIIGMQCMCKRRGDRQRDKQQGSKAGSKQAGRGKHFGVSQTWKRVLTRAVTTPPQWA